MLSSVLPGGAVRASRHLRHASSSAQAVMLQRVSMDHESFGLVPWPGGCVWCRPGRHRVGRDNRHTISSVSNLCNIHGFIMKLRFGSLDHMHQINTIWTPMSETLQGVLLLPDFLRLFLLAGLGLFLKSTAPTKMWRTAP